MEDETGGRSSPVNRFKWRVRVQTDFYFAGRPSVFFSPRNVILSIGASKTVGAEVKALGGKKSLIVTDLLRTLRTGSNHIIPPKNEIQIDTIRHHEKILEAIKDRDPVRARESMREHLVQMGELCATKKADYSRRSRKRYKDISQ